MAKNSEKNDKSGKGAVVACLGGEQSGGNQSALISNLMLGEGGGLGKSAPVAVAKPKSTASLYARPVRSDL